MPAKNAIKPYLENGYYHLYNRGIEKRTIFLDDRDYKVFLHFLKRYLKTPSLDEVRPCWRSDLYKEIQLLAFCLMPNHFHLLVKQNTRTTITEFMRRLGNAYVKYFNDRYERVGGLFQGRYKGVLVESKIDILHISRYVHRNPLPGPTPLENYPYSSYADYLERRNTSWVHPEEVIAYFKTAQTLNPDDKRTYQDFVENDDVGSEGAIKGFALEEVPTRSDLVRSRPDPRGGR